jgi:hypothetical protein
MLLRGHLQVWIKAPSLGGTMVVKVFSVDLRWLCNFYKHALYSIYSITMCFYQFHHNPSDPGMLPLYRNRVKLLRDATQLVF